MGAFFVFPTIYTQILYGFVLDVIIIGEAFPEEKNFLLGLSQIEGGPCQNYF